MGEQVGCVLHSNKEHGKREEEHKEKCEEYEEECEECEEEHEECEEEHEEENEEECEEHEEECEEESHPCCLLIKPGTFPPCSSNSSHLYNGSPYHQWTQWPLQN